MAKLLFGDDMEDFDGKAEITISELKLKFENLGVPKAG